MVLKNKIFPFWGEAIGRTKTISVSEVYTVMRTLENFKGFVHACTDFFL